MQHEYVQINEKKIVGFELQDADKMPGFILYMWAKLCPRVEEIKNVVDRSILYGVWYKPDGSYPGDDSPWCCIVGLEVNSTTEIPNGMVSITTPSGRHVKTTVVGGCGQIPKGWQATTDWIKPNQLRGELSTMFEKYDTRQEVTKEYIVELYQPIK